MGPIICSNRLPNFGFSQTVVFVLLACILSACAPKIDGQQPADFPQKIMTQPLENECNHLYRTNTTGRRLSWKSAVPIAFQFDPGFPTEFIASVEAAMERWNEAAGRKLIVSKGFRKMSSIPSNDGVNTIYYSDSTNPRLAAAAKPLYADDGTIAVTQIFYQANKIFDSDIVFNGIDNKFSTSRIHLSSFDVVATALHEIGHALGLAHNNDDLMSTMFFGELSFGFSLREIDSTSQSLLQCEYDVSQTQR